MESWGNCLTCARLICSRGGRARGFTRCEIVSRVGTLERRHNGRGCSQSSRDALPRRGRSNRCETLALVKEKKERAPSTSELGAACRAHRGGVEVLVGLPPLAATP